MPLNSLGNKIPNAIKSEGSFEPDSNQRPKDAWDIHLQSSALPTELSKAPLLWHVAIFPLMLTKIFFFPPNVFLCKLKEPGPAGLRARTLRQEFAVSRTEAKALEAFLPLSRH